MKLTKEELGGAVEPKPRSAARHFPEGAPKPSRVCGLISFDPSAKRPKSWGRNISKSKKGKKLTEEQKQQISNANLRRFREGKCKFHTPESIKKRAETQRGCIQKGGSQMGPLNKNSKICKLRSPENVVFHVANVTHFVRENPHLFRESDLIWKRYMCRASGGLLQLFCKSANTSWKGWTVVSEVEKTESRGKDLLNRIGAIAPPPQENADEPVQATITRFYRSGDSTAAEPAEAVSGGGTKK